jgi:hypothetical protein
MTTRPRLWFLLFSAMMFAAGTATGLLLSGFIEPPLLARPDDRGPGGPFGGLPAPTAIVQRMSQDLQLSKEQQQQLQSLLEDRRGRLGQFQQQVRTRFDEEHESLRASIRRILTPAQFERFEAEMLKRRRPVSSSE